MTFNLLNKILLGAGSTIGTAEAQGLLCGMFCAQGPIGRDVWLNIVLLEVEDLEKAVKEATSSLSEIYETTLTSLQHDDGLPVLYLPEDDSPMIDRLAAIAAWCQGFLYGLGQSGAQLDGLAEEGQEWLRDVSEIAQLSEELSEIEEENEQDYNEVLEYLRVGLSLLYDERHPASTTTTLH